MYHKLNSNICCLWEEINELKKRLHTMYGPPTSFIPGPKGMRGLPGSQIYTENGIPSNTLGNNGDFYLNNLNGNYYKKINNTWILEGNLTGPQ